MKLEPKPHAINWGKLGGDKTVISLTVGDPHHSAAAIADAVKFIQEEYPGAEIHVNVAGAWTRAQ